MQNDILKEIDSKLEEVTKFVKLKRKKIKKDIQKLLQKIDKYISSIELNNNELQKEIDFSNESLDKINLELKNQIKANKKQLKTLEILEKDLIVIQDKYDLVSSLLATKGVVDPNLKEFKEILYGEFFVFANKEASLADEADAILKLQSIERELELIVNFPIVHSKTIIAIGGGFSSGKSAFVNSFFEQHHIELPIGIEPVTAIPTYVVSGNENEIKGFSNNGNAIKIDKNFYSKLSHEFVKSFNFNLKNIMPFMTISTPLSNEYFGNICLIDTPGYNPAITNGFTNEDKKTAADFLEQANVLIWMIGLYSNGTIPASDLEFINGLNLMGKKLYIVANKSDLRAETDLQMIVDEIKDSLDDYDIEHDGISAFSANTKEEYLYSNQSLFDFLKNHNNPVKIRKNIFEKLDVVFQMYDKAISEDISEIKKYKANLKSLELEILESGFDNDNKVSNRIEKMKKHMDPSELIQQKQELEVLEKKMKSTNTAIYEG
jgi:hypothetical protein